MKGLGVSQDTKESMTWMERAAEHGHVPSMQNLGAAYGNGQWVSQDVVTAHMWLRLAQQRGHKESQAGLDWLVPKMTKQQIEQGEARAAEWSTKHPGL